MASDTLSNRLTRPSARSPGRTGSNLHSTRRGPMVSDSRRNAEAASAKEGAKGSMSRGRPVTVNWKTDGNPACSRRRRTGKNGRGSRVQKTNAATSSDASEAADGLPENGFRYSAKPREREDRNQSAWKAGMSDRREALMMAGGVTNVLYHPGGGHSSHRTTYNLKECLPRKAGSSP